jgi:hypothetical protein
MNDARTRRRALLFAALGLFAACGDNLIRDPSFDLWCGAALCAPWETSGHVSRVKTWHVRDYGVALDDGAALSQLSTSDPVSCIEFEVIADVDASAQVWLEMDFRDDGSTEYRQLIPESHWAKLSYLVTAPTWYDNIRFSLKKLGHGRAVLAQIRATPGDGCEGPPPQLVDRPAAASCDTDDQCSSGVCGLASPDLEIFGLNRGACGDCSTEAPCPAGLQCLFAKNDLGYYPTCMDPAPASDAGCEDDAGPCP